MEYPQQLSHGASGSAFSGGLPGFDMRDWLEPRRMTVIMWDTMFLLRHAAGSDAEDYDKLLDDTVERGYNTVRLDPLPQYIDLREPDREFFWPGPATNYTPWHGDREVNGPLGRWLIEFMEKLLDRRMHYTLSAWWKFSEKVTPKHKPLPANHTEGAEIWAEMLHEWKRLFGFQGLAYVDLANEVPYFFPGFGKRFKEEMGVGWGGPTAFTSEQANFVAAEINPALALLRREFPELRFTISTHGDLRWLDVPVELDCLDVHFYAEADARWNQRTRFGELMPRFFRDADWHAEFSERCTKAQQAGAAMYRARQRAKLARFAAWAEEKGMPLTTSESWSSWYYMDSPDLDWAWLLEWAEWTVEDAIDARMWGWTPHNYCQPQFENWKDVRWHQRLTQRFLSS
jgi:hypothetical protein